MEFGKNFGDEANRDLYRFLAEKEPIQVKEVTEFLRHPDALKADWWIQSRAEMLRLMKEPTYLSMGSILSMVHVPTVVWGAGIISPTSKLKARPLRVCAVRGPKTRKFLHDLGQPCPEVFGDPGILFPLVFGKTQKPKIHTLGVIPHYMDSKHPSLHGVHVIKVTGSPAQICDEIQQCHVIASSSLHGLIAADAYGIPSIRVVFGDKLIGGDFKFEDYFETTRPRIRPALDLRNSDRFPVETALEFAGTYSVDHLIQPLLASCPFLSAGRQSLMAG